MTCKYKDHPFPPCQFEQHPNNKNVYFCPHCRESYDVREIGNQFPKWLVFIIAVIILMIVTTNSKAPQPTLNHSHTTNTLRLSRTPRSPL
ncbi:MAG: hypothetical protein PUP92_13645 [Rhizonema sp. PD38]|nr:hypothetical protein [Rhizonema sp. PD38]